MALSESVLAELFDAFRSGDGVDLIRESDCLVLQELIEVEAAEEIGAARCAAVHPAGGARWIAAGSSVVVTMSSRFVRRVE